LSACVADSLGRVVDPVPVATIETCVGHVKGLVNRMALEFKMRRFRD
jgi:hypothetical protein